MSEIVARPHGGQLDTEIRSAVDDWPEEAVDFANDLAAHYPPGDPLPALAGAWIARQKTKNTRSTYVRQFRVWDQYARSRGTHPLDANFPLAEAFSRHLETAPTMKSVKGGKRGEKAPVGPPRSDSARANLLSACSSFHAYAVRARREGSDPFELVSALTSSRRTPPPAARLRTSRRCCSPPRAPTRPAPTPCCSPCTRWRCASTPL